jgi:hypothetical protein
MSLDAEGPGGPAARPQAGASTIPGDLATQVRTGSAATGRGFPGLPDQWAAVTEIGWAARSIKVRLPRGLARVT